MTTIRGTDAATVRAAIEQRDPFPGTMGFAGCLDHRLVRDVLGRVPLYVESSFVRATENDCDAEYSEQNCPTQCWSFHPSELTSPTLVPSGSVITPTRTTKVWELPNREPVTNADSDIHFDLHSDEDSTIGPDTKKLPHTDSDSNQSQDGLLDRLDSAIETTTASIDAMNRSNAIAFSGGVDSALLAAHLDVPLYVVGFPDSHDIEAARTAASALDRDLTVVELDVETLERAVPTVARTIGSSNAMDVSIALPLYLLGKRIADDGFDALIVGQGADELFGGYQKISQLDHRVEANTVRGAVFEQLQTIPDELPRDVHAVEATGLHLITPYLHDDIVDISLDLPDDLLAKDGTRKRGLRSVASRHLPTAIATREKKALQYGSLVSRELDRLARQAGFKRRMDHHVTQYVESRLDNESQ